MVIILIKQQQAVWQRNVEKYQLSSKFGILPSLGRAACASLHYIQLHTCACILSISRCHTCRKHLLWFPVLAVDAECDDQWLIKQTLCKLESAERNNCGRIHTRVRLFNEIRSGKLPVSDAIAAAFTLASCCSTACGIRIQ